MKGEPKRKGVEIGVHVDFDPGYFYFIVKNEIFKLSKAHAIRNRKIKDPVLLKKIKMYNAKLREKVGEIPIDIYKQRRIYCIRRDGSIADYGEVVGTFPNPNYKRMFSDDLMFDSEEKKAIS